MGNSTYQPDPIETADGQLPDELTALVEQLARNTHEVWASNRIAQGWRYGPRRDDEQKEHPCLVPYDDLPESEKNIDRQTAEATLKAIQALGFEIKPAAD